jgi:hypothetical protein
LIAVVILLGLIIIVLVTVYAVHISRKRETRRSRIALEPITIATTRSTPIEAWGTNKEELYAAPQDAYGGPQPAEITGATDILSSISESETNVHGSSDGDGSNGARVEDAPATNAVFTVPPSLPGQVDQAAEVEIMHHRTITIEGRMTPKSGSLSNHATLLSRLSSGPSEVLLMPGYERLQASRARMARVLAAALATLGQSNTDEMTSDELEEIQTSIPSIDVCDA